MRELPALLVLFPMFWPLPASSRDDGQWADRLMSTREWFNSLKQPDNPAISCCGEADAVEADDWRVLPGGDIDAIVTDGRGYVPDGTHVRVPARKLKQDSGNPTGHAILFLSPQGGVYCFVVGAGI